MDIRQNKTGRSVYLNDTAMKLPGSEGKPDQPVYELPSTSGANKSLAAWVKRAGIKNQIATRLSSTINTCRIQPLELSQSHCSDTIFTFDLCIASKIKII